ncbi:MAG: ferritin family protein [bacterium]
MELNDFKKTIRFALEKEIEAVDFYQKCSELTTRSGMKNAFLEMSEEEKNHVRMLENFKPEHVEKVELKDIPNLKIGDYLVEMEFSPDMSYQDLLILAMKREEKAHSLYLELAQKSRNASVVKLFQILAQEELKHKHRLEREYDDVVLSEN